MPYAICRVEKLKTFSNIIGSRKHTNRQQDTPNANRNIKNVELIRNPENKELEELVKDKIGDIKYRKDAVLCSELLLTASPEYFRPDTPEKAGYFDQEQLLAWVKVNLKWLKERYGNNLIKATLHLDESTPHIAAYVVPIYEKDGQRRLSHRELFGGNLKDAKLSKLQDDYAQAMAHLSLERGIKGSKAKHQSVKRYYAQLNQAEELERQALPEPQPGETAVQYQARVQKQVSQLAALATAAVQHRQNATAQRVTARSLHRKVQQLEPAATEYQLLQEYAPSELQWAVSFAAQNIQKEKHRTSNQR